MSEVIIAVDFDGTCVTHDFPKVGRQVNQVEEVLRELVAKNVKIILWTMRSGEQLDDAVRWFEARKIPLYGVNENPTQKNWTTSPKAYAQMYVDDAALGCPLVYGEHTRPFVNWFEIRRLLTERGFLD